jgi:hypothetical protein
MSRSRCSLNPAGLGQGQDLGAVQAAGATEVDVLDAGGGAQPGGLEIARQPAVVAVLGFAVDQQPESGGEVQLGVAIGALELLGQRGGHPAQA